MSRTIYRNPTVLVRSLTLPYPSRILLRALARRLSRVRRQEVGWPGPARARLYPDQPQDGEDTVTLGYCIPDRDTVF